MTTDDELDRLLRGYVVPEPPPHLAAQVLRAAAPLLRRHAAVTPDWALVTRAVLVAVLLLPLAVLFDVALLQGAYRLLTLVLPTTLGFALTVQYGLTLFFLFGATFLCIPVLAGHLPLATEDLDV